MFIASVLGKFTTSRIIVYHCFFKRKYSNSNQIFINGKSYEVDSWTNVTPKIISYIGKNLHLQKSHPLSLLRERITNFFYFHYKNNRGNPLFSVYDNLYPIVTVEQNFDNLLVPEDHVSRNKSDCYYLNSKYLLRGHSSAHENELIQSGLDNFLIFSDVYRRDQIDSSHYPVFHQVEGVRLFLRHELFSLNPDAEGSIDVFEKGVRTETKQEVHTYDAARVVEYSLKSSLTALVRHLFGQKVRWVDAYFPFTHPSFELEMKFNGEWMELLGCGVLEHQTLVKAGVEDKIGWAFGIGLERLAMILYNIPDIRLFWSTDPGFLNQFNVSDINTNVKYKPISIYPPCPNDISFWLPGNADEFSDNDFYDLVRTVAGDVVEQVNLVDKFYHPKKKLYSRTYRIVYRHMEKTLTQEEVNKVHRLVEEAAERSLEVKIR
ncbi:hypothetical protein QYM36_004237 [Artemia franciscana]|uniref:Phenylalanine--tRNA ligase, mitochondrial n=1 Tax=Artemia franciscana TaxID=6661 RepID=A0AA88I371_ARTSF|nr:hypothetical protein QYM36_004237 [Artemia franciscana]